MSNPMAALLLVALILLIMWLVGGKWGVRRGMRSLVDPPDQVIKTRRRFVPWGWGDSELVYHTDRLIRARGRRRVARSLKRPQDRDQSLEQNDQHKGQ